MTFQFEKFGAGKTPGRISGISNLSIGEVIEIKGTKQRVRQLLRYHLKKRPEREYSWAIDGEVIAIRRDK